MAVAVWQETLCGPGPPCGPLWTPFLDPPFWTPLPSGPPCGPLKNVFILKFRHRIAAIFRRI